MPSGAAPALTRVTKLSFRRDVRLFLTLLVGFLVVLIAALVLVLESLVARFELAERRTWNTTADAVAAALAGAQQDDVRRQLDRVREHYKLAAIALAPEPPPFVPSPTVTLERQIRGGTVTMWFDAHEVASARRAARMTIAICSAAAGLGLILLFLYLPRVVDPIERMLDDAQALGGRAEGVDDASYLVDTFRKTIETMQLQSAELEVLHERERLRANELELLTGTLTRSLTSGFVAVDAAGILVNINNAAREILSLADAAPGRPLGETLPPSPFAELVSRAFAERLTISRVETGHGASIVGLSTVPLINEEGAFLGMMVLFTDVTPIRELETRVREQQALADLGEMSAGIAHEFRNALSTIMGYLRLARRQELPGDADARVQAAERESAALSAVVDSLLRFARPLKLELEPVELRALLAELARRVREQHGAIDVRLEGEPVMVNADPAALRTSFENLLRNAVESIGERPGRIDIEINAGAEAAVTIRDDGAGVDPRDVPRLFLPFQSGRPGGTGLGLPLARKIVIGHGGTLALTGQPGAGACVVVTLPVTKSNNSRGQQTLANAASAP